MNLPSTIRFLCHIALSALIHQSAQGQYAPSTIPLPSAFRIIGTYMDSDGHEEEDRDRLYTLGPGTAITDGESSGSYSYTKTGSNSGILTISVSFSGMIGAYEITEHSEISYVLTFTSETAGTCTFSGTYEGVDDGDRYSETVSDGLGVFTLVGLSQTVEDWREQYFGISENFGDAANDFDYDGDGVPNLLEYALGTSPVDASDVKFPETTIEEVDGQKYLSLTIDKPVGVSGIEYSAEVSSDLEGDWAQSVTVTEEEGRLTVRDNTPQGLAQRIRFIRLRVAEEP